MSENENPGAAGTATGVRIAIYEKPVYPGISQRRKPQFRRPGPSLRPTEPRFEGWLPVYVVARRIVDRLSWRGRPSR